MKLVHELRETVGNFSSTDIQWNSGISEKEVSNRTIRRRLRMLYRTVYSFV